MLTKFSLQTSTSRLRQSVVLASASELLAMAHQLMDEERVRREHCPQVEHSDAHRLPLTRLHPRCHLCNHTTRDQSNRKSTLTSTTIFP
jgi:hypothetical protein